MAEQTEIQLYLPTTLNTKVNLRASHINRNLDNNIQREVERKYGNKFFSFGHVRPGTIKIINRSIGNKIGAFDFTGNFNFDVTFSCEVFLPQIGQLIDARVKSIQKIGILAKSDSNKLTILLSKPHQSNLDLFSEVMLESRIRARILDFKINSQDETIVVIGDLVNIIEGVYQNYQLPRVDNAKIEVIGEIVPTSNIKNLYTNYSSFIESINSKSLMDPYAMVQPDNYSSKDWSAIRRKKNWIAFKDYWINVRSMVEDYELVYPANRYNKGQGIAILPFKSKPISRAFFKLWELFYRYKEIMGRLDTENDMVILNLGEAPGGFIQATAHYRLKEHSRSNDTYFAYSLKPEDMKKDYGLTWENQTTKAELGKLNNNFNLKYADLTKANDLKKINQEIKIDGKPVKADLITADAAYTHAKVYNYEEIVNYKIFFGEIAAAIMNQKQGGTFVIKVFDLLTQVSRQLLLLLNHYYSEILITKPDFSRPASSEKYLVCLGFKGVETSNQTEESLEKTIMDLFEIWNEKIINKTDIYYPDNDNFLLKLLGYNINDNDDFSQKIDEISRDHILKQSEHITNGIHLIHTKTIFEKRKVNQIKQNQLKQAINWCQRYKLEYLENLDFTEEEFLHQQVVNTKTSERFSLKTLKKDNDETFLYLKDEYKNINSDYLRERSLALNELLQQIYGDYTNSEIYEFKTSRLNPTPVLNETLNRQNSLRWYVIHELLSTFNPVKKSSGKFRAFINLDSITADATQSLIHYFETEHQKIKLEWLGSVVWKDEDLPDPTGMFADTASQWLMGSPTQSQKPSGLVSDSETIDYFSEKFKDAKDQVDLYLSDFHVPISEDAYGVLILYPERYFMREYIGQILSGLISLKEGGTLMIRQYSFFENPTIEMIALLEDLFEEVTITKPLISQMESAEVYLVATNYRNKKFTQKMKNDLMEYINDLNNNRDELMEQKLFNSLPVKVDTDQTAEKLIYVAYRIYVLNQFPRLQINLDIFHNPKYKLNSQQMSSAKHLLDQKQGLINKSKISSTDRQELIKIDQQMEELFSEVTNSIVREDFRYILEETVNNWNNQFPLN